MPTVVCQSCRKSYSWKPKKGDRMVDQRCPDCGGPVAKLKYPAAPLIACGVCGRRRGEAKIFRPAFAYRADGGERVYAAGTPCCGAHRLSTEDGARPLEWREKDGGPPP